MKKGKMMFLVVPKGDSSRIMDSLRLSGATGGTVVGAKGTASSSLLSLLGFGDSKREVVFSMIEEDRCAECEKAVLETRTKGIMAFLGKKEGYEMNEEEWTMIQVICEAGYADDIMAAARKAGAKGGTVIKGHGTAKEDDIRFFGYPITAEKEVLLIVERSDKADGIIREIDALPFLAQKGKAVVFSLPVSSFHNLG